MSKSIFTRSKPNMPSNTEMFTWAEELIALTDSYPQYRRYGTEGNLAATKWIYDKLISFGFEKVEEQPFEVVVKEYTTYQLIVDNEEIPSFFMQGAAFTDDQGVSSELIYVGDTLDPNGDYRNKIVVMDLPSQERVPTSFLKQMGTFTYDPENFLTDEHWFQGGVPSNFPVCYYTAAEMGAVGFIGIFSDYLSGSAEIFPDPTFRVHTKIPGLFVGKYDGERLIKKIQSNRSVKATLVLCGEEKTSVTNNVVATLPGQKAATILLNTHHDAGFSGAVQDGSGVVALLGIAKYFSRIPLNFRQKTLVFVFDSAHFDWNYPMGANMFQKMNPEIISNVVLTLGVEHIGVYANETEHGFEPTEGPEPRFMFTPPNQLLQRATEEAIQKNNMVRTIIPAKTAVTFLGETQSYYLQDIPSFSLIAGPKYLFCKEDTLEMLCKDQLEPVVSTFVDIVDKVMYLPPAWLRTIDC